MTDVRAGIYAGHEFPAYEYREFPKHVHKNGKTFVANNKGEELRIASMADEPDAQPSMSIDEAAHQAALAENDDLRAQIAALKNPPKNVAPKNAVPTSEK